MVKRLGRRVQFSLLSLLALMTAICLALTWWVWPHPVDVVATVRASAGPRPIGTWSYSPESLFIDFQEEVLSTLNDPALLKDAVAITGNGRLRMLRGRSDPEKWLRDHLEVKVLTKATVSVKLSVPPYFTRDAVEVIDYITLRAVADVNRTVLQKWRAYLREGAANKHRVRQLAEEYRRRPSAAGSPVIVQPATVVESN